MRNALLTFAVLSAISGVSNASTNDCTQEVAIQKAHSTAEFLAAQNGEEAQSLGAQYSVEEDKYLVRIMYDQGTSVSVYELKIDRDMCSLDEIKHSIGEG